MKKTRNVTFWWIMFIVFLAAMISLFPIAEFYNLYLGLALFILGMLGACYSLAVLIDEYYL